MYEHTHIYVLYIMYVDLCVCVPLCYHSGHFLRDVLTDLSVQGSLLTSTSHLLIHFALLIINRHVILFT